MQSELELLTRLLVAGALCGLLGWEREHARKSAGLRTHMLVGIGAALYTAIGQLAVTDMPAPDEALRTDPIRSVQAVAIGIGFLGSGVIFVSRHEDRVHGLTTAASVWAARRHRPGGRAGALPPGRRRHAAAPVRAAGARAVRRGGLRWGGPRDRRTDGPTKVAVTLSAAKGIMPYRLTALPPSRLPAWRPTTPSPSSPMPPEPPASAGRASPAR